MSTFQVNVFIFGESIDHLVSQVSTTLNSRDFGEFVAIVGTSSREPPKRREYFDAEVAKLQESIAHHEERIPILEGEMEAIRGEMKAYKRKKESKRDAAHSSLPLIGYFDSEYHRKERALKEKLGRVEFYDVQLTSLREKLTVAQRLVDEYPTPEQLTLDEKRREQEAIQKRKKLVLQWCVEHGGDFIAHEHVCQIIVNFIGEVDEKAVKVQKESEEYFNRERDPSLDVVPISEVREDGQTSFFVHLLD